MKKNKSNNQGKFTILLVIFVMISMVAKPIWDKGLAQEGSTPAAVTPAPIPAPAATATPAPSSASEDTQEVSGCSDRMFVIGNAKKAEFMEFLNTHFASKASTSSLLPQATDRYQLLKDELMEELSKFYGSGEIDQGGTTTGKLTELLACEKQVRAVLAEAEKMLEMRATTTAVVKKASVFAEKYQQINSKMRDLQLDFLKLTVNFAAFEQKLPCYLKTCL